MPTSNATAVQSTAPGAADGTAETLGWQLRAALPPLRLHSVSLFNAEADVLWLSEGALGPDEHGFVLDALDTLDNAPPSPCLESDMGDGRGAVFLAVRSPQAEMVGLAMILVDAKALNGQLGTRILSPQVRAILQRIAILLRPASAVATAQAPARTGTPAAATPPLAADAEAGAEPPPTAAVGGANNKTSLATAAPQAATATQCATADPSAAEAPAADRTHATTTSLSIASDFTPTDVHAADVLAITTSTSSSLSLAPDFVPGDAATQPEPDTRVRAAADVLSPQAVDEILEFELSAAPFGTEPPRDEASRDSKDAAASSASAAQPDAQRSAASASTASPAQAQPSVPLLIQPLARLRPGGRTRRYEISHIGHATALDALLAWLAAHPGAREGDPLSFIIDLPAAALQDEPYPGRIETALARSGVPPEMIGFQIAQRDCVRYPAESQRFASACERLGCFLVIDDFTLASNTLECLRSPALRMVQVDARLTAAALRDRLAQALVVAISQAAKVLGIHCAAKGIERPELRRWVGAIGFDFAQGALFDPPQPLDSLLSPPATRT